MGVARGIHWGICGLVGGSSEWVWLEESTGVSVDW